MIATLRTPDDDAAYLAAEPEDTRAALAEAVAACRDGEADTRASGRPARVECRDGERALLAWPDGTIEVIR